MGIPLHTFTMESVIRHLIDESSAGDGGYVVTPNLDNLFAVSRDRELRDRALAAEIRVADGMPLVWASRIKGDPLPGRVAGSDLILQLADEIAAAGKRLFLLGGEPGTADRAADTLRERSPASRSPAPTARRTGSSTTPTRWPASRQHWWRPSRTSSTSGCRSPRPARWPVFCARACPRPGSWAWGSASASSAARWTAPPRWMQKGGLEWLHRLRQEPRRLARRYLMEGGPFALRLFWTSYRERRATR